MADSYDVVVIGGGPAGYPAAIRAAQNRLSVACIDEWRNRDGSSALGGTCLNAGCIPSKVLLESTELLHRAQHEFAAHGIEADGITVDLAAMQKRRATIVRGMTQGIAGLFKAAGVTAFAGHGRLLAAGRVEYTAHDGAKRELAARHVILASGSVPVELKSLPFDGRHIIDSWGALELDAIPQRLGVIGAGVIGPWTRAACGAVSAAGSGGARGAAGLPADGRRRGIEGSLAAFQEARTRHSPRHESDRPRKPRKGRSMWRTPTRRVRYRVSRSTRWSSQSVADRIRGICSPRARV